MGESRTHKPGNSWRIGSRAQALVLGAALLLSSGSALGQSWEPIEDPKVLTDLFSETVMEAELAGGARAVARYDADGTGVLEAWGDRFDRTWAVEGDRVCLGIGQRRPCFRIERNTQDPEVYRASDLETGESLVFSVRPGEKALDLAGPAPDGGAAKPSAEEIAATLANPNTPLATLTTKLQFRTYQGDLPGAGDQTGTTLLVQPSFPFPLSNGDVVFLRPAIPLQFDQPVFDPVGADFGSEFGLGDIAFDLAYGRTTKSGVVLAAGLVSTLPTATDDALGPDRFLLGPEFLIGKLSKTYVIGAFPNHQWDVGGSGDADVSLTSVQLFGTYLPGGGWNVGTSPVLSYDHLADQWTIPLNLSVGKTVVLGGRPWKLGAEINYYVEQPDAFGPRWFFGISVAPVVENPFVGLFR